MNFYSAIKQYEHSDINSKLENASKHDFIKIVLEELSKNLKSLKYAIENEGKLSKTKSKSFSRIITSITVLTSSLDFENGGEIAENLFRLYEFARQQLLESFRTGEAKRIDAAIHSLSEIRNAWNSMERAPVP